MITDWDVHVVGQQRVFRAEETADARGVMDGGVEVGVVRWIDGLEEGGDLPGNKGGADGIARRLIGCGVQQVHEAGAQGGMSQASASDERIKRGQLEGGVKGGRKTFEEACTA